MKDASPQTIHLSDYTPFGWHVDSVHLTVRLDPMATRVRARIHFSPAPDAPDAPFFLHGEDLTLLRAAIDGTAVSPEITDEGLTCAVPKGPFLWDAEVEIAPGRNTALEGLYMSPQAEDGALPDGAMYCTQCEAEGFRKITFYPDRPDVMSIFTVRIESDLPVLLSNGNRVKSGEGWAEWHDPWPKPAYLFALVAGDLKAHPDRFTTASGRDVDLNIWVRPGDEGKCAFGMQSLKASMRWDERVYGREYDLDVFNIVAVDDFNMGAMENKGLNIFNSACVLASPETATDSNFERIEAIIAHEYFHNWTGNRITCRDWFQLCLKEGLTVFRDQQFTADMRSAPVARIEEVAGLRAAQFPEDNGPLAHPVRPESYQEINNFYTATVYEKGAEVIGMLKRLVGDEGYGRALDLYFDRHDGDAATIEDWLKVFEDATGRDLAQFKRWYSQAGTPRLSVKEEWDADTGRFTLHFAQTTPPTPGQSEKAPQVIPIAVGLLGANGDEIVPTRMLEMTQAQQSFDFDVPGARPIPSILRGFSAPVILERDTSAEERRFLLAHDTDPFNRWEAARQLCRESLVAMITEGDEPDEGWLDGVETVLRDRSLDPSFRELMLSGIGPSELAQTLHERGVTPDPQAIWDANERLAQAMAERWRDLLPALAEETRVTAAFAPSAEQAGKRVLGNAVLGLRTRLDGGEAAAEQFARADNMTLSLAALSCLIRAGRAEEALQSFRQRWSEDRLVMDKWFGLQIGASDPSQAVERAEALTRDAAFDWKTPNRFRAVLGTLAGHHAAFHRADGSGYAMLSDWLLRLDGLNPQTAARMTSAFQSWRRYDADRQEKMRRALERLRDKPDLSRDSAEMVGRILS